MVGTAHNQGVMISGAGRLQADVLAVGDHARASKQGAASPDDLAEVRHRLAALCGLIEEQRTRLADADELKAAVDSIAAELEQKRPSKLALTSILDGIARSAEQFTGIVSAAVSVKELVGRLFA